jgi:hypothetical protein
MINCVGCRRKNLPGGTDKNHEEPRPRLELGTYGIRNACRYITTLEVTAVCC